MTERPLTGLGRSQLLALIERQRRIIDGLFKHTSCYPDCGSRCMHDPTERERVLEELAQGKDPNEL